MRNDNLYIYELSKINNFDVIRLPAAFQIRAVCRLIDYLLHVFIIIFYYDKYKFDFFMNFNADNFLCFHRKRNCNFFLEGNDISFGIYIYQMVVVNAVISLPVIPNRFIIAIIITILFAYLSWRFIEKPVLRF